MKDIKEKIKIILQDSSHMTEEIQAEMIIESVLVPLAKEAFEHARFREEAFDPNGYTYLKGYMFKDAEDWINEKFETSNKQA